MRTSWRKEKEGYLSSPKMKAIYRSTDHAIFETLSASQSISKFGNYVLKESNDNAIVSSFIPIFLLPIVRN